jgi:hypothetical protein
VSELLTLPLAALPAEVPLKPGQRRVLELEARIAEQAAFIRLLKRNGEAVLAGVGQDVLKDLRRSLQAARNEMKWSGSGPRKAAQAMNRGGEVNKQTTAEGYQASRRPATLLGKFPRS